PSWLLSGFIIAIFLPEELSFDVFGLRLTAARLFLFLLFPLVLGAYGRLIGSGRYRFALADFLMPLTGLWMIGAPSTVNGFSEALIKGGVMAFEFVVAYAAMRAIPQGRHQAAALFRTLCVATAIAGYLSVLDPTTGQELMHDLATDLSGYKFDHPV